MFCGLILYDKDGGLLQIFVHIKYFMLWYFAVIKYVFEIDKVNNFSQMTRLIANCSCKKESFFNCYHFPIENGVSKIVCWNYAAIH